MIRKTTFILGLLIMLTLETAWADSNEKFDTNVVGASLISTLQGIALKANKNIVINGRLEGEVTVYLKQKTVKETLDYLSKIFDINCTYDGDIITVGPNDVGAQTKMFNIKYADLDYVKSILGLIVPDKRISISKLESSIVVSGTPNQLTDIQKQLEQLDVPQQQVYIKVKIVQLNKSIINNLGLSWTLPSYSFGSAGGSDLKWTVAPNAERIESDGKTLAEPSISTINGREAKLSMGQSIPAFTTNVSDSGTQSTSVTYQDVGIYLTATPRVNEDGTITCTIKPTIKVVEQWVTDGGHNKAAQISTREAQTVARVQSGKTIIIGGLIQNSDMKTLNGIPGFNKIPLLGNLFKNKNTDTNQTEVFIFITPEVKDDLQTATENAEKAISTWKPTDYKEKKEKPQKTVEKNESTGHKAVEPPKETILNNQAVSATTNSQNQTQSQEATLNDHNGIQNKAGNMGQTDQKNQSRAKLRKEKKDTKKASKNQTPSRDQSQEAVSGNDKTQNNPDAINNNTGQATTNPDKGKEQPTQEKATGTPLQKDLEDEPVTQAKGKWQE